MQFSDKIKDYKSRQEFSAENSTNQFSECHQKGSPPLVSGQILTGGDHGLDAQVLRHLDRDLGGLQGKLSGRHNDHALDDVLGGVDLLQAGNRVCSSLSGSVLCSRQNVPEIGFQGDILTQRVPQTHRPERAIGMLASWIGLGFSQPFSKIP